MFARIIRKDNGHSSLYECQRVHSRILKNENGNDDDDMLIFDFESRDSCISVELDRKISELYLMNNEGKTIETYKWYPDKT